MKALLSAGLFLLATLTAVAPVGAFPFRPPAEFREYFSEPSFIDEKERIADRDCSIPMRTEMLNLTCASFYTAVAIGSYANGQYRRAENAARTQLQYEALASPSPCPAKIYFYDSKQAYVGGYQFLYEISAAGGRSGSEFIELGIRAYVCEAIGTLGYNSDPFWTNLGDTRLDQASFEAFMRDNFGDEGARQVSLFIKDVMQRIATAEYSTVDLDLNGDPAHVASAVRSAELYRNAATYADENLDLDSRFVEILRDFAAWNERQAESFSR